MAAGGEKQEAELFGLVHDELQAMARVAMDRQASDHILQPTALVNEAWLRLFKNEQAAWENRHHFLGVAAQAMRSVLVDHARRQGSAKGGGALKRQPLQTAVDIYAERAIDLVELDDALDRLAQRRQRQAKVVVLRFFGGLSIEEVSATLGTGHATIERDWYLARAWLRKEMESA